MEYVRLGFALKNHEILKLKNRGFKKKKTLKEL